MSTRRFLAVLFLLAAWLPIARGQFDTNPPGVIPLTGIAPQTEFPVLVNSNGYVIFPTNFVGGQATNVTVRAGSNVTVTTNGPSDWTIGSAGGGDPTTTTNIARAATGITNANGVLVTNVVNVSGQPMNVNLGKLWKWQSALIYSNRPIRWLRVSDIDNWPGSSVSDANLGNLLGRTGGGLVPTGGGTGDFGEGAFANGSAQAYQTARPAADIYVRSPGYWAITNNAQLVWFRRSGGTGVADTNFLADKFSLAYVTEPLAGTFKIQTNLAGAGWGDFVTINANTASATNIAITNLTFTAGYYSVRALGVTGTNRMISPQAYLSTTNTLLAGTLPINSGGLYDVCGAATNNSWPYYAMLNPDLITILDTTGSFTNASIFGQLEQMLTNACPNADVIYIGQHKVSDAVEADPTTSEWLANQQWKAAAIQYGRGFFDTWNYLGTDVPAQVAAGIMQNDNVHVTTGKGADFLNSALLREMMSPSLQWISPFGVSSQFTGGFRSVPGVNLNLTYGGGLTATTNGNNISLAASAGSSVQTVYKPAPTSTNSSTALVNDPDLTIACTSGKVYYFEIQLVYGCASGTPGFKTAIVFPTITGNSDQVIAEHGPATSTPTFDLVPTYGAWDITNPYPLSMTSQNGFVRLKGVFKASAGGSITVQWAQNTSSTDTTYLFAGSFIRLQQLN